MYCKIICRVKNMSQIALKSITISLSEIVNYFIIETACRTRAGRGKRGNVVPRRQFHLLLSMRRNSVALVWSSYGACDLHIT